jgi:hypothetical protein
MPQQDYNKNFTRLPDSNLKNIRKDAKEKNAFLESVRPEVPDEVDSKIKSIPFVGSFISSAVRGVAKKIQAPIDDARKANRRVENQAWNETFKRQEIKNAKQDSGLIKQVLGIENDPNEYGKTALGNPYKPPARVRDIGVK